jgi:ABC-2 type transport system ATP-binding protein
VYGYRPFYRAMPAEYRNRVERLAEVVGLGDDLFRPLKTFSGGMSRKLEIVRSLMHRPAVLFLDEPTSGLDPISRRGLWDYLREVRNEDGTTVFLTTHYLDEAEGADRVCVIDHGKVAVDATPDELKTRLLERTLVLDAADRGALRSELIALGLAPQDDPGGELRIDYRTPTAQDVIARIRTPLTVLRIREPSLEEAYIELLRDPEEAVA